MKIGFIGLGMMGRGMASNLLKAGHKLVVNDLAKQIATKHLEDGATWADTPRALAEACDVVFTSLPTPTDVEAVGLGENGLAAGFKKGAAWFDLSTNAVDVVRRLNKMLGREGHRFPRCAGERRPCRRRQRQACHLGRRRQGGFRSLQIGARRDGRSGALYRSDRRRNDRQADAQHGERGHQRGAGRSLHHGRQGGRRAAGLWKAIRQGALGRMYTFEKMGTRYLPGKYDPPSFALRLVHKDVLLALQLGREVGVPMRICNLVAQEITEAMNRGWGQRDSQFLHGAAAGALGYSADRGADREDPGGHQGRLSREIAFS